MMRTVIAITDRLMIRAIEEGDSDYVYRISQESPLFSAYWGNEKYVELYRQSYWEETIRPDTTNGMIFLKGSGAFVGRVCMQHTDHPVPELGIDILKAYQNKGYGPEAIIAFCSWYAETYGVREAKVRIERDNTHSLHVFEKLGAEFLRSTSFLSKEVLEKYKKALKDVDLTLLSEDTIKEYRLQLPVHRKE